jgi:integrase
MTFYRKIVRNLSDGEMIQDTPDNFSIGDRLGTNLQDAHIGRDTFKIYAAAIRTVLIADEMTEALRGFDASVAEAERPAPHKRGALKFVPDDVRLEILNQLNRRSAKHSAHVASLICATALAGLRPKEWSGAILVGGDTPKLIVRNGKYRPLGSKDERSAIENARRGNGESRTLLIDTNSADLEDTMRTLRGILEWERLHPWATYQRSLRRELSAAIRNLVTAKVIPSFYQKITPYSFRHQAAADAKATFGTSTGEAAAILGHASSRTAVASYGRPRMGRSGMRVKAAEESVALVDNLDIGDEAFSKLTNSPTSVDPSSQSTTLAKDRKPED